MSGGGSLHGKDWLKLGGAAALAATGMGALGIGPLAGLLGASGAATSAGAGAVDALGPGLGAPLAAGFGPAGGGAVGGASIAGDAAAIPSITSAGTGASGMGGGTASLFGGGGAATATEAQPMITAALGTGSGGISAPTFADKAAAFFSPDAGQYRAGVLRSGVSKLAKAQTAYKAFSGLLGGPPSGAAAPAMSPSRFGAGASPSNLSQYTSQPNSMMPQAQGGQLTPEMLALLLKMQQGQGYG